MVRGCKYGRMWNFVFVNGFWGTTVNHHRQKLLTGARTFALFRRFVLIIFCEAGIPTSLFSCISTQRNMNASVITDPPKLQT